MKFTWVLALLLGGVIAAPIAAWLAKHVPPRILGSAVGGLIVLTNTDNDTFNTLVVDTETDSNDGTTTSIAALMANKGADGKISLREAITASYSPLMA